MTIPTGSSRLSRLSSPKRIAGRISRCARSDSPYSDGKGVEITVGCKPDLELEENLLAETLNLSETAKSMLQLAEQQLVEDDIVSAGGLGSLELCMQEEVKLVGVIQELLEKVRATRAKEMKELGEYSSLHQMIQALDDSAGRCRGMQFCVEQLRWEKHVLDKRLADLCSNDVILRSRYSFLEQARSQLDEKLEKVRIEWGLVKKRLERPSLEEIDALIRANKETLKKAVQVRGDLEKYKIQRSQQEKLEALRKSTKAKAMQLLSVLEALERQQSEVCERKLNKLTSIVDGEETRLKRNVMLNRVSGALRGGESSDAGIDFESKDIEAQKYALNQLHWNVQSSEEKRMWLSERIADVKKLLKEAMDRKEF